jgi:hypothetical protein
MGIGRVKIGYDVLVLEKITSATIKECWINSTSLRSIGCGKHSL